MNDNFLAKHFNNRNEEPLQVDANGLYFGSAEYLYKYKYDYENAFGRVWDKLDTYVQEKLDRMTIERAYKYLGIREPRWSHETNKGPVEFINYFKKKKISITIFSTTKKLIIGG